MTFNFSFIFAAFAAFFRSLGCCFAGAATTTGADSKFLLASFVLSCGHLGKVGVFIKSSTSFAECGRRKTRRPFLA